MSGVPSVIASELSNGSPPAPKIACAAAQVSPRRARPGLLEKADRSDVTTIETKVLFAAILAGQLITSPRIMRCGLRRTHEPLLETRLPTQCQSAHSLSPPFSSRS